MSTLSEIEIRRIKDETIRSVIDRLTQNARTPERIGKRVLAWKFQLRAQSQREKLLSFSKRLGMASSSASVAVTAAETHINDIRFSNMTITTEQSG
jgi:uncharacterized protein YigA (DUF484 family)